jgi:hypothetical protein
MIGWSTAAVGSTHYKGLWVEGEIPYDQLNPKVLAQTKHDYDYVSVQRSEEIDGRKHTSQLSFSEGKACWLQTYSREKDNNGSSTEQKWVDEVQDATLNKLITGWVLGDVTPVKNVRGLKRFTMNQNASLVQVLDSVGLKLSIQGESDLEKDFKRWIASRIGQSNAIISMGVDHYPIGEVLYDYRSNSLWIRHQHNYGAFSALGSRLRVLSLNRVAESTNPNRYGESFSILEVAEPSIVRHEGFAQGGAMVGSMAGGIFDNWFNAAENAKYRDWMAEQNRNQFAHDEKMMQLKYYLARQHAGAQNNAYAASYKPDFDHNSRPGGRRAKRALAAMPKQPTPTDAAGEFIGDPLGRRS